MKRMVWILLLTMGAATGMAADGGWLKHVPAADRGRENPHRTAEDVAAGGNLYRANCAHCHGEQAQGRANKPALRSSRIGAATDGELAWLLKNGNVFKGMPSWSGLPEAERWQVVAYLRSLNTVGAGGAQ